jgi:adenylylsulfate kinase
MHSPNTFCHKCLVSRKDREKRYGHPSFALWFTGLSSSGKSTIAHLVEKKLFDEGYHTYTFDGDNVRHGLCGDLGFSEADRAENLRRIAEMIKLFLDAGIICLAAFISPLRAHRERVRQIVGPENLVEIYVKCPLEVCESRDVKGLYKKARAGLIPNYTGISAPYEEPENPDLVLETDKFSPAQCVEQVLSYINKMIKSP